MPFARFGVTALLPLLFAGSLHAQLPPRAQEALDKGIIAAKVSDYRLAIHYFEQARKTAPQAPVLYLNLGLAESKIPGRDLRAIAWFGAYLAAQPQAPNAAAVKEQIVVLEVRSESDLLRLMGASLDAARQLSAVLDSELRRSGSNSLAIGGQQHTLVSSLASLAKAQMEIGHLASAHDTLLQARGVTELIQSPDWKSPALGLVAGRQAGLVEAQLKAEDFSGARKTADGIRDDGWKGTALRAVALSHVRAADFTAARQVADLLHPQWKRMVESAIADAQAARGKPNAVVATAQPASVVTKDELPLVQVSEWLKKLDDDQWSSDCPLKAAPFLDLGGYLKSLRSDDPKELYRSLSMTVDVVVRARSAVSQALKQQAQRTAVP